QLSDDVEHRIVVQGVANLLKFFEQTTKDVALDGVRRDKVENEAVLPLAVPVNAPHPLFEAVGIPRNVVVEEDVAHLEVDALARRFSRDQNLDCAFPKLLLR